MILAVALAAVLSGGVVNEVSIDGPSGWARLLPKISSSRGTLRVTLLSRRPLAEAENDIDRMLAQHARWEVLSEPTGSEGKGDVLKWVIRPVAKPLHHTYKYIERGMKNCSGGARPYYVASHGFAVDVTVASFGMQAAGCTGRAISVRPGGNEFSKEWHYSVGYNKGGSLGAGIRRQGVPTGENAVKPVCAAKDFSCFFLEATKCKECVHNTQGCESLRQQTDARNCVRKRWNEELDTGLFFFSLRQYFIRPVGWLRRELRFREAKFLAKWGGGQDDEGFGKGQCATVHVRRADVSLGKRGKALRYVPLKEFVEALEKTADGPVKDVLLMSDSATTFDEAKEFPQIRWVFIDRKRFKGSEGGWENHFPSGDPREEVINILLLTRLVPRCRAAFIASGTSSFSKFMHEFSCLHGGKWKCPPKTAVSHTLTCKNCTAAEREKV
eukprot:Hpha_TRINITY_DN18975_c0_g1::TRINITY_DN18975_c0_g1_i1::g.17524::m.17524